MNRRTRKLALPVVMMICQFGYASDSAPPERHFDNPREQGLDIPLIRFDKALAQGLNIVGDVVGGARWNDREGDNILILTQTGLIPITRRECITDACADAELYAYHYVWREHKRVLLWSITDYVRDCPFDIYAGFILDSLTVTDLDADGIAESAFLYKLACRSDVSPATLKLIMHEGSNKFAIRGSTRLPDGYGGGEIRLGRELKNAGASFKTFAVEQWEAFVEPDEFEQF